MASDKVNFGDVGAIAQAMKYQARSGEGWNDLPPAAKEAIDQILSSIARTRDERPGRALGRDHGLRGLRQVSE